MSDLNVSSAVAKIGGGPGQSLPIVCFLGKDNSTIKSGWVVSSQVEFDPAMPIAQCESGYMPDYSHTPFITMPVDWTLAGIEIASPQFSIGYTPSGTVLTINLYVQNYAGASEPIQLWQGSTPPENGFLLTLDTVSAPQSSTCGISLT
jgi:hypothetical protein